MHSCEIFFNLKNCKYRYGVSPVHIVSPDHSVKVHGDVLVIQLTPHDVVSVLQQIIRVIGELSAAESYANRRRGENPCFGSRPGLDPDSIGSTDLEYESGFGSS
jgi:hypothetical protein